MLFPKLPKNTKKLDDVVGIQRWEGFVVDCLPCSEYSWVDKEVECLVSAPVMLVWAEGELEAAVLREQLLVDEETNLLGKSHEGNELLEVRSAGCHILWWCNLKCCLTKYIHCIQVLVGFSVTRS